MHVHTNDEVKHYTSLLHTHEGMAELVEQTPDQQKCNNLEVYRTGELELGVGAEILTAIL